MQHGYVVGLRLTQLKCDHATKQVDLAVDITEHALQAGGAVSVTLEGALEGAGHVLGLRLARAVGPEVVERLMAPAPSLEVALARVREQVRLLLCVMLCVCGGGANAPAPASE